MRPSSMVVKKKDDIHGSDWACDSIYPCGPKSRDWKKSGFSINFKNHPLNGWLPPVSPHLLKAPQSLKTALSRGSSIQNWIYDIFHIQIPTASKQRTKIFKIICLVVDFRWDSVDEPHPYYRAFEITQSISVWQPTNHLTWSCLQ